MAKFCGNCGTKLSDDAAFCTNCGTPCKVTVPTQENASQPINQSVPQQSVPLQAVQQATPQPVIPDSGNGGNFIPNTNPVPNNGMPAHNIEYGIGGGSIQGGAAARKPMNKKALMVGGILAGLIILLIVVLAVAFSGSYEDPLDNYVKVLETGDAKAYKESMSASKMGDIAKTLYSSEYTDAYYAEEAMDLREDFIDDFGPDAKVEYKILDKTEMPEKDIRLLNATMSILDTDFSVSKGYTLKVAFTYDGTLDKDIDTVSVDVIKIDGDWVFAGETPSDIYPY